MDDASNRAVFTGKHVVEMNRRFMFRGLSRHLNLGETLLVGGCGEYGEGSAKEMREVLTRLASLPDDTVSDCWRPVDWEIITYRFIKEGLLRARVRSEQPVVCSACRLEEWRNKEEARLGSSRRRKFYKAFYYQIMYWLILGGDWQERVHCAFYDRRREANESIYARWVSEWLRLAAGSGDRCSASFQRSRPAGARQFYRSCSGHGVLARRRRRSSRQLPRRSPAACWSACWLVVVLEKVQFEYESKYKLVSRLARY